jgi:hypothetical protein
MASRTGECKPFVIGPRNQIVSIARSFLIARIEMLSPFGQNMLGIWCIAIDYNACLIGANNTGDVSIDELVITSPKMRVVYRVHLFPFTDPYIAAVLNRNIRMTAAIFIEMSFVSSSAKLPANVSVKGVFSVTIALQMVSVANKE